MGLRTSPLRRIAAFAVDWLVLALYAGLYYGVVWLVIGPQRLGRMAEHFNPYVGQAIGFTFLTLPFLLYFATCEASRWQATLGKRLLGLNVVQTDGHRARFTATLVRATLKLLPWEIAHVFTNHLYAHSVRAPSDPIPEWLWAPFALSMTGAFWFVVTLFVGDGHTPYDRLARTRVVEVAASAGQVGGRSDIVQV